MRQVISLVFACSLCCSAGIAKESEASKVLTEAEKAKIRAQVEDLKKNKMDDADRANKAVKSDAVRQGQEIDKDVAVKHKQIENLAKNMTWMYGPDAMRHAAEVRKHQVNQQAQAAKDKIKADAQKKAAGQRAAAQRSADSVEQSVEGLKSQVGKDGQFGLQPKGSNLHVRNYGK